VVLHFSSVKGFWGMVSVQLRESNLVSTRVGYLYRLVSVVRIPFRAWVFLINKDM
jgi:hypothetical protein